MFEEVDQGLMMDDGFVANSVLMLLAGHYIGKNNFYKYVIV